MVEVISSLDLVSEVGNGGPVAGFDWGWPWLRRRLGPLAGGSLCVVGARDGVGKSFLLLHILNQMASAGQRVHYASMEDSRSETGRRLGLGLAHHNLSVSFPTGSVVELISTMEQLACPVAVDYLQILTLDTGEHGWSREDEIARSVRALKGAARRMNLPVILASQVGRPAMGDDPYDVPSKYRLAESSRIEKPAEYILMMGPEADHQHVVVEVAKAKDAPIGHRVRLRRGAGGRLEPAARVVDDDDGDDDCSAVR